MSRSKSVCSSTNSSTQTSLAVSTVPRTICPVRRRSARVRRACPRRMSRAPTAKAVVGMPVRVERLEPFLADVAAARGQPLLTRKDLDNTSMASGFDALLMQRRQESPADRQDSRNQQVGSPSSRCAPHPRILPTSTTAACAAQSRRRLPDERPCSTSRVRPTHCIRLIYWRRCGSRWRVFAAIVILLLITLRSPLRVARVVTPLALAVLAVAGGFALVGHPLTILHVIGMLLIVAVGSNYALFFDRRATDAHPGSVPLTLASLIIANVATVVSFGILAFSSVPVLAALGSTVAPGALLALVFSALLARHLPQQAAPVVG